LILNKLRLNLRFKVQGLMNKGSKRRASAPAFVSEKQMVLVGFESPFSQKLDPSNRWVRLSAQIPWDELCNMYLKIVGIKETGRRPINPRVVIGSLMIKHICHLDDRETVDQISENMYMQYFLGYQSFSNEAPFDASLFVEFRKRMGMEQINEMNDKIHAMYLSRQ
jgi:IS5 family transposase